MSELSAPVRQESYSEYVDGIRRAERMKNSRGDALIRYARDQLQRTLGVHEDAFGHIDTEEAPKSGISQANARELSDPARWVLREPDLLPERPDLLFFGAGCGLECAQARAFKPDAFIAAFGLSPIDPFRFPLLDFEKMQQMAQLLEVDGSDRNDSESRGSEQHLHSGTLLISRLVETDRRLNTPMFFRELEQPYIDEQRIGWIPKEVENDRQRHFFYDSNGPFHKMSAADFIPAFRRVQEYMDPSGIFIIDIYSEAFKGAAFAVLEKALLDHNDAIVHRRCRSLIVASLDRVKRLMELSPPWLDDAWETARR